MLPRMHLAPDVNDENAPEAYSERLLQARLASFWREVMLYQDANYDSALAEERYERFCKEFLATLPPAFALEPNTQWDKRLDRLPFQRQILHISVFDSLCRNFRGLLFQDESHIKGLPGYKRALISSQKNGLAVAALEVLQRVAQLHALLGGSHTRFPGIVFPTFEAAVLLAVMCKDLSFPEQGRVHAYTLSVDPLGCGKIHVTREKCLRAAEDALERLRTLAEIIPMAERGATTLSSLLKDEISSNLRTEAEETNSKRNGNYGNYDKSDGSSTASWNPSIEATSSLDLGPMNEFLFTPSAEVSPNWDLLVGSVQYSLSPPR